MVELYIRERSQNRREEPMVFDIWSFLTNTLTVMSNEKKSSIFTTELQVISIVSYFIYCLLIINLIIKVDKLFNNEDTDNNVELSEYFEFLKMYIKKYPERPMLRLQVGDDRIKVRYQNKW